MSTASAAGAELKPEDIEFLDSLQVGDLVEHPKWGIGSILSRSGLGELTKLIVAFPEAEGSGQKKLMASYARLRKIEDSKPPTEEAARQEEEEKPNPDAVDAADSDDDDDDEAEDTDTGVLPSSLEDDEEDMASNTQVPKDDWEENED